MSGSRTRFPAAVFLASDAACYINGKAIAVDGGLSSSLPILPPKPKPVA